MFHSQMDNFMGNSPLRKYRGKKKKANAGYFHLLRPLKCSQNMPCARNPGEKAPSLTLANEVCEGHREVS